MNDQRLPSLLSLGTAHIPAMTMTLAIPTTLMDENERLQPGRRIPHSDLSLARQFAVGSAMNNRCSWLAETSCFGGSGGRSEDPFSADGSRAGNYLIEYGGEDERQSLLLVSNAISATGIAYAGALGVHPLTDHERDPLHPTESWAEVYGSTLQVY